MKKRGKGVEKTESRGAAEYRSRGLEEEGKGGKGGTEGEGRRGLEEQRSRVEQ